MARRISRPRKPAQARGLLLLLAMASGCGGGHPHIDISVTSVTGAPRLQPGSAAQVVLSANSGSFDGAIALSQTTITFTSASGAVTATPTGQTGSGSQITLNFSVPTLSLTTASTYQISVSGSTQSGQPFSSPSPFTVTVYPSATIASVSSAVGYQNQTLTVAITGSNTDFVQGQTQATFGAGVSVNGAAVGLPGLITVSGAGSATASVVISPAAALGARDVVVTTGGQTATLTGGFTIGPALLPIIASSGGPYTGFTGRAVQFNGSLSQDPNGQTLSYSWNFGDNTTGTGVQPTHTYTKPGTFAVQLTLTDPLGVTATATTTATITTLLNPTAVAGGTYTGTTGQSVAFDGSASTDPNGSALTYAWTFGDGATGSGSKPSHSYATPGTFSATLTVTDTFNLSGTATATVTVANPVLPPVAQAGGPYTGTAGTAVTFNASASTDPQGQTLTYSWDFGDGTTGTGPQPTHTYVAAATYTVHLTVTNTSGLTASATATATIAKPILPPLAQAGGPYTGTAGTALTFNGSGSSDPNGQILTYAWDFGDGTTGTGAQPSHTYATAGTYTATLTVTNTSSLTATATTQVTIASAAGLSANPGGPYTGTLANPVVFNGSGSSDPKGETLAYAWDFGDGSTATGVAPSHQYTDALTYTVTLTVTNTDGITATATTTAAISSVLSAVLGGPATGNVNQSLSFTAVNSTAPGTDILQYSWNFGDGTTATGLQVTHAYTSAGSFNVMLTVTDTVTQATAKGTASITITQPPAITFTAPVQGTLLNTSSVSVSGTAGASVQSVTVNGIAAALSGGTFTATVPLREGVNILTATGLDAQGNPGTASTSVTVDLTPPIFSVLQPLDGSTVTTQQIAIAGMVTDQVTGTINANDVTVTVNGLPASVSNRSFMLSGVLLVPGANTLQLVATDKAGNAASSTLHVNFVNTGGGQHIVILSGDGQSGQIGSVLPQPLTVQLVSATGSPLPNRAITFTVTASDGVVESLPQQAQTLALTTDAQGKASVLFKLGARAGLGINQVSVTSAGFIGSAVFSETSTPSGPAYIHEFMGNNQRGILGQPLAQAFQVLVQDVGGDPIAGVPVTFTMTSGDALFSGNTTATVNTNSDGRAMVTLTLGQQEGVNNNTATADFPNDPNAAVIFHASSYSSGAAANTSVSGVVLDNAGNPVPNATASLMNTPLTTTTDANGHFVLKGAPVGTVTLLVDGSTTSLNETLPSLSFLMQALPGQNNTLSMPVYLPIIDTASAVTAGGNLPATLSLANMPGVALTIAPNSVTFPDGSHVGQITLSQVKSDLVPMPPPNGVAPGFAWTIQPAGTKFSTPVTITIPNTQGLPPGQVQEFYQYDHDLEQFVSIGTLRVSPDGSVLNTDPGFGITKAGWSSPGSNPPPGACGQSCDDNNVCTTDTQNSSTCACTHTPKSGGCGNNPPSGANNCQQPGMCVNGACTSKPKPPGSSCDDGQYCTDSDQCGLDGACRGTAKPDMVAPFGGVGVQVELEGVTLLIQSMLRQVFGAAVGNSFSATIGASGQTKQVCCESKKGQYVDDTNATYSASGGISTPPIYLVAPPWSIPFPKGAGGYGVFVKFGVSLTGQIELNDAKCKDYKCAIGTIQPSGTVTLGGGADAIDPINGTVYAHLAIEGTAGLNVQIQSAGDCKSITYSIGLNSVNVNLTAQFAGIPVPITIPLWNPVGAFTFAQGSIPLP